MDWGYIGRRIQAHIYSKKRHGVCIQILSIRFFQRFANGNWLLETPRSFVVWNLSGMAASTGKLLSSKIASPH